MARAIIMTINFTTQKKLTIWPLSSGQILNHTKFLERKITSERTVTKRHCVTPLMNEEDQQLGASNIIVSLRILVV